MNRSIFALTAFFRAYAADGCLVVGAVLIGIGVWRIAPTAVWFYAGICCWLMAWMLAGLERGRARTPSEPAPPSD